MPFSKAYYEANKEALAQKRKAYYEANKEKLAEKRQEKVFLECCGYSISRNHVKRHAERYH